MDKQQKSHWLYCARCSGSMTEYTKEMAYAHLVKLVRSFTDKLALALWLQNIVLVQFSYNKEGNLRIIREIPVNETSIQEELLK